MLLKKIKALQIVLGSQSPRRCELLKSLDLDFQVVVKSIDETLPIGIQPKDAAVYIALKKLEPFRTSEFQDKLVITADTVVVDLNERVLGKPMSSTEAVEILQDLNANRHFVYTGVAILFNEEIYSFTGETEVIFDKLSTDEIVYYVEKYKPYDKAGSYGIQEWIGRIGVKGINGSYENVMGLPTNRLYKELLKIEKGL